MIQLVSTPLYGDPLFLQEYSPETLGEVARKVTAQVEKRMGYAGLIMEDGEFERA